MKQLRLLSLWILRGLERYGQFSSLNTTLEYFYLSHFLLGVVGQLSGGVMKYD